MARALLIFLCAWLALPVSGSMAAGSLVALGDSYSSGEGVPPFEPGTDTRSNTCHRSPLAWPGLIAGATKRPWISFACSGAETVEVTQSNASRDEPERRVAQIRWLKRLSPELVTVTIGGNDVGFVEVLKRCITGVRDCRRAYTKTGRDVLDARIESLGLRLPGVYSDIRAAAPFARLIVVGYPRIFRPRASSLNCAALFTISRREVEYLNEKSARLNRAIHAAARRSGVPFIDVTGALAGHELSCLGSRWIHPLKLDPERLVSPFSFHPNRPGHAAIAKLVRKRLAGLGFD